MLSFSRSGLSSLFTSRKTGLSQRLSMRATDSSSSVTPVRPSTTNRMTAASSAAARAWSRMDVAKTSSLLSGSMPPVSTMVNSRPFQSAVWYERSRVTPRDSWTMASEVWARRLTSVDLPTLGRPTTATIGFICSPLMGRVSGISRVGRRYTKDALQGIEQLMRHGRHHMNLGAATGKACE